MYVIEDYMQHLPHNCLYHRLELLVILPYFKHLHAYVCT